MEALYSYIPLDRRLAIAGDQLLPDRTTGAVLFADISGFTPLTETLLRELGRQRGAEELTRQLNQVYTTLIDELHRYRGSVIGFAGDAITCWLEGDDGHRATACALAMQAVMKQFATVTTPTGTSISLAIKVGIAVGPARRFLVGDPEIQLVDVLAGEIMDRVAQTEEAANRTEVGMQAALAKQLGSAIQVAEWRQSGREQIAIVNGLTSPIPALPWPHLPPEGLDEAQTRPWLLEPVYEKLRGGNEFLAELRPAVIIFQQFRGLDYDLDDAGQQLDAFIRWVQRTFTRFGGTLLALSIGDKGSYLYAVFGAPIAHSDDPVRAVAAALELRTPPPELSFISDIKTGISQGHVYTGAYGSESRRTYGVLGNEVNMAARFMDFAQPGQVVVSKSIADLTTRSHLFQSLGKVKVKGAAESVSVYEAVDRRRDHRSQLSALFTTPLVGREELLIQVHDVLDLARTGTGQVLRLHGSVGSGKSHFTAVVGQQAMDKGWQVVLGTCQSISQNSAYVPWRQIFYALLDLDESESATPDSQDRQIAQLETLISSTNPDWLIRLPLLGNLLDIPIPDNPTTAAFEPRLRQESLFALAVEMVLNWAQSQPLLLILEDSHWLDEASIGLTTAIGRALSQSPVTLLIVQREMRDENLPELDALSFHQALEVNELPAPSTGALISNHLPGSISATALSLVQAKTEGNPFFVKELVDTLRESAVLAQRDDSAWDLSESVYQSLRSANCLVQRGGEWVLAENAPLTALDLGVPDSIQGAVLARIDRLPETHKLTLKVSSVVGQRFELDLLDHSHPYRPGQTALEAQTQEMETRDFIILERPARPFAYLFRHYTTQEVAYETLLFAQRQQLHRAVTSALETLRPSATEQLAHHAYVGRNWPRALHYQLLAGQHAQQLSANDQAIEHFAARRNGRRTPDHPRRLRGIVHH
jgi:class 3 adenylate cyclase